MADEYENYKNHIAMAFEVTRFKFFHQIFVSIDMYSEKMPVQAAIRYLDFSIKSSLHWLDLDS